jgi:hypothetical protein
MQADFLNAHERHWGDAERLFAEGRYANADHLYGMAAECGLKRLMVIFGMVVNPATGSPTACEDRSHANDIWARFEGYRSGKVDGVDYGLPTPNPFGNWHVSDRYAHQSYFNQTGVQVQKAQWEGLLL